MKNYFLYKNNGVNASARSDGQLYDSYDASNK